MWVAHAVAGYAETLKQLIRSGGDINTQDADGMTAVYMAAYRGHNETVHLLIDSGADANQVGSQPAAIHASPKAPLSRAFFSAAFRPCARRSRSRRRSRSHPPAVDGLYLLQSDHDGTSPLYLAAQQGHGNAVELLLHAGASINVPANSGPSPLYAAAEGAHVAPTRALIKAWVRREGDRARWDRQGRWWGGGGRSSHSPRRIIVSSSVEALAATIEGLRGSDATHRGRRRMVFAVRRRLG